VLELLVQGFGRQDHHRGSPGNANVAAQVPRGYLNGSAKTARYGPGGPMAAVSRSGAFRAEAVAAIAS
jgi:hypothetical protein